MEPKRIEWVDSSGCMSGWQGLEGLKTELTRVVTYGIIVYQTEELIAVAQSYAPETISSIEQVNGVITIPKSAIISISSVSCQEPESGQMPQQT